MLPRFRRGRHQAGAGRQKGTVKAGPTGTQVAVACEKGTGGQLLEGYLTLPTVQAAPSSGS